MKSGSKDGVWGLRPLLLWLSAVLLHPLRATVPTHLPQGGLRARLAKPPVLHPTLCNQLLHSYAWFVNGINQSTVLPPPRVHGHGSDGNCLDRALVGGNGIAGTVMLHGGQWCCISKETITQGMGLQQGKRQCTTVHVQVHKGPHL